HKKDQIRTISIVSHSTGGPVVKGVLGGTDPSAHPWINYVDDHLNLAGALGGTKFVFIDAPASVLAPDLRHQLMYGVQHPSDYTDSYRYFAGRTAESGTFKRTYRWPDHINVLSVAGVMVGTFDGDPWSGDQIWTMPWNGSNPLELRSVNVFEGKTDGVVPSMAVIEHVQYKEIDLNPLPGDPYEWRHQISPDNRSGVDFSSSWILPNLGSSFVSVFTGGSGFIRPGTSSNADNVPAADRFRGSKVTYVEVNAQHNGILHNEHVLRLIRKRLGTYTVTPYIDRPIVVGITPASGSPEGGNVINI